MINFSCSQCGKNFSVEAKYSGRASRCPQCKMQLTVPHESESPAESSVKSKTVLQAEDGMDIFYHALVDAQEEKTRQQKTPPPPKLKPKPLVAPQVVVKKSSISIFWIAFFSLTFFVIAGGAWFILTLEKPDLVWIEANELLHEARTMRSESLNLETRAKQENLQVQQQWREVVANYLQTQHVPHEKIEAAEKAEREVSETQLQSARVWNEAVAKLQRAVALLEATNHREKNSLEKIEIPATKPTELAPIKATEDWTEFFYDEIDCPSQDDACLLIDTSQKLVGTRSWRLISHSKTPFIITVPKSRDAAWNVTAAKKILLGLRFPLRGELPSGILTPQTSQIASLEVTLGGDFGTMTISCLSPRLLEVMFYKGLGKFVTIEIPLVSNNFWQCREEFSFPADTDDENSATENSSSENANAENNFANPCTRFLSSIRWVQLKIIPCSPVTSVSIDDIRFSSQNVSSISSLPQEEATQREERRRWQEGLNK